MGGLAMAGINPVIADDSDTRASASLVTPVSILSGEPLEFGELTVPASGECLYALSPEGSFSVLGAGCMLISGQALPARFEVGCGQAGTSVRYEVSFVNSAPAGAIFEAGRAPVQIDGAEPGNHSQVRPCDGDGTTVVSIGGQLRVTASAPSGFSGPVGTIRLEANFE